MDSGQLFSLTWIKNATEIWLCAKKNRRRRGGHQNEVGCAHVTAALLPDLFNFLPTLI
jgi:hypothetical protein